MELVGRSQGGIQGWKFRFFREMSHPSNQKSSGPVPDRARRIFTGKVIHLLESVTDYTSHASVGGGTVRSKKQHKQLKHQPMTRSTCHRVMMTKIG